MKQFGGQVLFLDRSDINTDEIIPAKYLTENTKQALQPYLLEDLKLEGSIQRQTFWAKKSSLHVKTLAAVLAVSTLPGLWK